MEAILPFKIKNEQKFFESALKVGYNEMEILKFVYIVQQSDLDIFPRMHDERINILLYGWELCEDYKQQLNPNEWELPEELETILKLLVPWSMDIWFSKEWDKARYFLKTALIHCLNRARDLLMRMPDMMQINWDFLLLYNLKPWNVLYLKNLTVTKDKTLENGAQCIETEELPPTDEDIAYVKLEQLPIIVLRLVKFFDQSSIDMVKTLCMRVIAAWNKIHQAELETSRRPYIPPEDKKCLLLICHIYLMAVYESDDVKGYVIDNMINNIRFYYQGFQNSTQFHVMNNFEYTPARYIALTNFHLRVQKRDFFDFFIWNKYDTSQVNLFGVVSQAYKSYLLGNLLMELNNMNEDDFAANIPLYKRLMNSYVNEREKSEIFLLNELTKIEHQRYAHNVIQTVKHVTDFESKICKGNRMSNIGNYENSDDTVAPLADKTTESNDSELQKEEVKEDVNDEDVELEQKRVKESELRLDPVFQNLPNNESMLYYVYEVLAKKDYKGWHFAKVVLLVKIIGHEQNMIETWRYHPGLTTDFMLNLEVKLSHHYVDLAKIFKDHPFLEQEFWLTAFYLNPTSELYEVIKRLGMRNNRKRTEEHTKLVMNIDNIEAKYGLLSSTIDVKDLATMSNTDDPGTDYDPLFAALHSLRVPDSLIKDMLTAIFLPRNKGFAWAVDWVVLRNRCKIIMTSSKEKKRFVDLNMAEANERLKFLIIDYDKYKNRPQLDYGTIEQGYENLMGSGDFDKDSSEEEDEEEEDFEDDEDVYESKKRGRGRGRIPNAARKKEEEEKAEDDNSQEDDPFLSGKRRTRARTAATLASILFQTLPRSSRRKRNQKSEEEAKVEEEKLAVEQDDRSSDSKSPVTTSETPTPSPVTDNCEQKENAAVEVPTKNLKQCLKERPSFLNTTHGFQNLIDIWNVEKEDLQSVDENCVSLMESSAALQIAVKLKILNKEINPISCDDKEYIDDREMTIHNAEYAIKLECEVEDEEITTTVEEVINVPDNAIEVDHEENVETQEYEPTNVEACTEKPANDCFKLPEDTTNEKETIFMPMEIENIQEVHPAEESSSESVNSDMSTAARKDSGEVSESNTEANSKRNSLNIDIEVNENIEESDTLNEQNDAEIRLKEIIEKEIEESLLMLQKTSQQITSDQDQTGEENKQEDNSKENKAEKKEGSDIDKKLEAETDKIQSEAEKKGENETKREDEDLKESPKISDEENVQSITGGEEEEHKLQIKDIENETEEKVNTEDENVQNEAKENDEIRMSTEIEAELHTQEVETATESDEKMNIETENKEQPENEDKKGTEEVLTEIENTEQEEMETQNLTEVEKQEEEPKIGVQREEITEKDTETEAEAEIEHKTESESKEQEECKKPEEAGSVEEIQIETEESSKKENNSATENKTLNEIEVSHSKKDDDSLTSNKQTIDIETPMVDEESGEREGKEENSSKTEEEIVQENNAQLQEENETSEELRTIEQVIEIGEENNDVQKEQEENENENEDISSLEVKEPEETILNIETDKQQLGEIKDKDNEIVKELKRVEDTMLTAAIEEEDTFPEDTTAKHCNDNEFTTDTDSINSKEVQVKRLETAQLDVEPEQKQESQCIEEIKDSIETDKSTDEHCIEETLGGGTELKENIDEVTTAAKIGLDEEEITENKDSETRSVQKSSELDDVVETKDLTQDQNDNNKIENLDMANEIVVINASDLLFGSLAHLENQATDMPLYSSTSEELKETPETNDKTSVDCVEDKTLDDIKIESETLKLIECEKGADNFEDPTNKESDDNKDQTNETKCETKIEATDNTCTDDAISDQEEREKHNDTKTDEASNDQEYNDTKKDETESDQTKAETTDCLIIQQPDAEADNKTNLLSIDETSADTASSADIQDSTDSETTRDLKNLCLRKSVKVLLQKLRPFDLTSLRQPQVKIQRLSYEKYLQTLRPKRKRVEGRAVYLEFDDSSNSNISIGANSSSSEAYRPPKTKKKNPVRRPPIRQTRTSDSDNDSNNSEDIKLSAMMKRKRRCSSPPSTSRSSSSQHVTGPKSARKSGPKSKRQTAGTSSSKQNLVVTPRSASGLKLRISNPQQNRQASGPMSKRLRGIEPDEVIQLSSTSSDELAWAELPVIVEEIIEIDENTLFEEEIII